MMNKIELYEKSTHTKSGIRFIGLNKTNDFKIHWHEHVELHFMVSGEAKVRCGSQVFHIKKHDCLIINSNELHEGLSVGDGECFKFTIKGEMLCS